MTPEDAALAEILMADAGAPKPKGDLIRAGVAGDGREVMVERIPRSGQFAIWFRQPSGDLKPLGGHCCERSLPRILLSLGVTGTKA